MFLSKKYLFLTISFLVISYSCIHAQDKINWITWQELELQSKEQPKKIVVDMFTDWCGWCKKMEQGTFNHPVIVDYINDNYYAVKFNAETKETIEFNSKSYRFVRTSKKGYNELALELSNGKLSYPTIIFLDEEFKLIQPIHGFIPPDKFEMIITYFGDNHHKSTPWVTFQKNFKSPKPKNEVHLTGNKN